MGTSSLTITHENGADLCAVSPLANGAFGGIWSQLDNPPDGKGTYSVQYTGNCMQITIGGANAKPVAGQSSTIVAPPSLGSPLSQGQASITFTDTCTRPIPQMWSATGGTLQVASVATSVHDPSVPEAYVVRWNLGSVTMAPIVGSVMSGLGTFQLDGFIEVDPYDIAQ